MSALYTHYQFGIDVLTKLYKKQQLNIKDELNYYNMFNQGFDNLYYHYKWKYYKKIGLKAHKKNIDILFKNMFQYIKDNNLEKNSKITNMIYGIINHYTLDTIIHPYINYQVTNLNIPHTKIEFMLDSKIKINKKNIYKILIPKLKFDDNLINFIDYIFAKTYNEENIGKVFNKSHNNSYYLYKYFIQDSSGIKTFIYKIIDFILPFKKIKFNQHTYYLKEFNTKILNNEKNIWRHPQNNNEKYNYSYPELYNYALKISIKLNKLAFKVLHNKANIDSLINNIKLVNVKNIQQLLQQSL